MDEAASRKALEKLREEVNQETGKNLSLDEVAWGWVDAARITAPRLMLTSTSGFTASSKLPTNPCADRFALLPKHVDTTLPSTSSPVRLSLFAYPLCVLS